MRQISSPAGLDVVEPLWNSLREHYEGLEQRPGPVYGREESWRRRRKTYEQLLSSEDGFILIVEDDNDAVAYAAVRIQAASPVFAWAERTGYVETFVVDPSRRGDGIGRWLLERIREQLGRRLVNDVTLHVLVTNEEALEFYERQGFRPYCTLLSDAIPSMDEDGNDPSLPR